MGDDAVVAATQAAQEHTSGAVFRFFAQYGSTVMTIVVILAAAVITYVLKRLAVFVLKRMETRLREANNASAAALVGFSIHLTAALIYLAGGIVIIGCIPGLESALNRLLTMGGVIAVVAGLASQEALGSMVCGVMILIFKPFQLGDAVRYVDSDISGVVEEITVHHTTIRTWENKRVIIPNSKMNSAILENSDYGESKVCLLFDLSISYESDLDAAKRILTEQIVSHPDFYDNRTEEEKQAGQPPVTVRVSELADSGIVLRAFLWARDSGTAAAMKSDLLQSVKQAYDAAGISIPYPHMVIVPKES